MTTLTAREFMTRDVLTVHEEMSVAELAVFLAENEITGAAVRNDQGRLVGVVSLADIAACSGERSDIVRGEFQPDFYVRGWEDIYNREEIAGLHVEHSERLVRDVMNSAVYTVPEDTEIAEVAQKMLRVRLHRMFVTRGDKLTGIISTSDFLKLFVGENSVPISSLAAEALPARPPGSVIVPLS